MEKAIPSVASAWATLPAWPAFTIPGSVTSKTFVPPSSPTILPIFSTESLPNTKRGEGGDSKWERLCAADFWDSLRVVDRMSIMRAVLLGTVARSGFADSKNTFQPARITALFLYRPLRWSADDRETRTCFLRAVDPKKPWSSSPVPGSVAQLKANLATLRQRLCPE